MGGRSLRVAGNGRSYRVTDFPQTSPIKGSPLMAPTVVTPGTDRTCSTTSAKNRVDLAYARFENRRSSCSSMYFRLGTPSCTVRTRRASNPASARARVCMLFIIKPAPMRSTSDSAVSPTTRAARMRCPRGSPPRAPSLRASPRSTSAPRRAGTNPKRTPVSTAMSAV